MRSSHRRRGDSPRVDVGQLSTRECARALRRGARGSSVHTSSPRVISPSVIDERERLDPQRYAVERLAVGSPDACEIASNQSSPRLRRTSRSPQPRSTTIRHASIPTRSSRASTSASGTLGNRLAPRGQRFIRSGRSTPGTRSSTSTMLDECGRRSSRIRAAVEAGREAACAAGRVPRGPVRVVAVGDAVDRVVRLGGFVEEVGEAAVAFTRQRCSGFGRSKRQPASQRERWLPWAGIPPASRSSRARCSRFQVMNVVFRFVKSFPGPPESGSR